MRGKQGNFGAVVAGEVLKLRRSRVPGVTFAVYALMVVMVGFFFWMMQHPAVADSLGLLGQKAKVALGGESLDGPTFCLMLREIGGLGGMLLSAVVVIFVFGREYTDGTAKVIYTLPVPRSWFVLAKFVVSALWFLALTLWAWLVAWAVGGLLGLPGLTWPLVQDTGFQMVGLALMAFGCASLPAWVAVATRGYFAPLGFAVFTMVLASVFGHTGWAPWVPWSIVGLASGAAGPGVSLDWPNYLVVGLTFVLGVVLTIAREAWTDNRQ